MRAVGIITEIKFTSIDGKVEYFKGVISKGKSLIESLTSKKKPIVDTLDIGVMGPVYSIPGGRYLANKYVDEQLLLFLKSKGLNVSDECLSCVKRRGVAYIGDLHINFNLDLHISFSIKYVAVSLKNIETKKSDTYRGDKIFYVPVYEFGDLTFRGATVYKDSYFFQPDKAFITTDKRCIKLFNSEKCARTYISIKTKPNIFVKMFTCDPNLIYGCNVISTLIPKHLNKIFGKRAFFANWTSNNVKMLDPRTGIKLVNVEKYIVDEILKGDI